MINVIYVDDEANAERMKSKFEVMHDCGVAVIAVADIEAALPAIRDHESSIRAVVIDRIMPPRSIYSIDETDGGISTGLSLLRDIRAIYPNIPIVIVSVIENNIKEKITKLCVAEYVTKPVTGEQLATILKKVVDKDELNA